MTQSAPGANPKENDEMRMTKTIGSLVAAAAAIAAIAFSPAAQADEEFDVIVKGDTVSVKPKGHWHCNKEYPWSVTVGDTKLKKDKFTIEESGASVKAVPKGAGKLKGGVCSGEKCKNFEVDVTIR